MLRISSTGQNFHAILGMKRGIRKKVSEKKILFISHAVKKAVELEAKKR